MKTTSPGDDISTNLRLICYIFLVIILVIEAIKIKLKKKKKNAHSKITEIETTSCIF